MPQISREDYRERCRDLFYFCKVVLAEAWPDRFHDFAPIHKRMCDFIMDPKSSRKFLSAFRGSFKTTVLEGFFVWNYCWTLDQKGADAILYNTATKENTWNLSANIKHTLLENEFLHWLFPRLLRDERDYKVMTKNRIEHGHVRMDFSSLETTLVSRHYPKFVNDDIENDENSRTEYMREEIKRKWRYQKAILTKVSKRGIGLELEVGTPYHYQGLIWKIANTPTYEKLMIPYREEGKLTFPELYKESDFAQKREDMGARIFASQYELLPQAEEDALCIEKWLKRWKTLPIRAWRSMVVDPGGAEPGTTDATGITILDTDEQGMMYVVYAGEHWVTPNELIELIVRLKDEYQPDDIRIEKEKYSVTIADMFQHRYPLLNISFVEHKHRKKELRIWRLKQHFEKTKILLGQGQEELETQLLTYPGSRYDDLLDSLSYHLDIRRIPPKIVPHRLPSGRVFEANISESFDEEFDKYMGRLDRTDQEDGLYDQIY